MVFITINMGYFSSFQSYLELLFTVYFIYPISAVVLFYALCHISSNHLVHIQMEIDELIANKPIDTAHRVKILVEHYFNITDFVRQINRCFDAILFLVVFVEFVLINTHLFLIVVHYVNENQWYFFCFYGLNVIFFTINIFAVSFASGNVCKEVFSRSSVIFQQPTT